MRRAVAAATLCLLVVSSGCNGVLQERTPPVTRAPFDVPDETIQPSTATTTTTVERDPGFADVAPGLVSHGIRDAFELSAAHRERLSGESFRVRRTYVVQTLDGTVLWRNSVDVATAANHTRYRITVQGDQFRDSDRVDRYFSAGSDDPLVVARTAGNDTEYEVRDTGTELDLRVRGVVLEDPTYQTKMYRLLGAVERASVSPDDRVDPNRYVVRARVFHDTYLIRGFGRGEVRNVSLVAIVRKDGLIERLFLGYETRVDGRRVRVQEQFAFVDVGETTVTPPDWVETARKGDEEDEETPRIAVEGD